MNTALIIDNELHDAEKLIREIRIMDNQMSIGAVIGSVEQSVQWLEQNPSPDLIFMDIKLRDGDSFRLFNRHVIKCPVIFTVYYEREMIRTFHEKQINYLLKPFNHEALRGMMIKVRNSQLKNMNCHLPLQNSLLRSENSYLSRIIVKDANDFLVLPIKDIACFNVQLRSVFAVASDNRKFLSRKPLHTLEQELDPKSFYRANRQLIVNGNYISSFRTLPNNNMKLKLKINMSEEIVVSKFQTRQFVDWIETCCDK